MSEKIKTLQECKDEVAKKKMYLSWQDFLMIKGNDEDEMEGLMDEASELYASQFKSSTNQLEKEIEDKWISVEERLPEQDIEVQAWNRKWKLAKLRMVGDTVLWHYDGDNLYTYDAPTHWMPLPSQPIQKHSSEAYTNQEKK